MKRLLAAVAALILFASPAAAYLHFTSNEGGRSVALFHHITQATALIPIITASMVFSRESSIIPL